MGLTLTAANFYSAGVSNARVTITGSGGGFVVVYGSQLGQGVPFAAVGSQVGDGQLTAPLAPGVWVLWASSAGVGSIPVMCQVTGCPESIATRCQNSIISVLKALNLPGIRSVLDQIALDRSAQPGLPAVFVTIGGESETIGNWTVNKDQKAYPFRVTFLDSKGATDQRMKDQYQFWREKITRTFTMLQLPGVEIPGVDQCVLCRVTPTKIASDAPQSDKGYRVFESGLIVRAECVEPRGIGA